jgi:SAM-dependent methyltransferase
MTHTKESFDPRKYWEDRLEAKFDLTGVGFRRKSVAFNKWAYRIRADVLDELISKKIIDSENKAVLDIGCGTGFFIKYWQQQKGKPVAGLDITEVSINQLKEAIPDAEFHLADLSDPDLKLDNSYDLISIFDVLFHIVDDDKFATAVANLAKISKPGAQVIITDMFKKKTLHPMQHCRNRSLGHYQEVFSKNSFELKLMMPLFFVLLPPSGLSNSFFRWAGILVWEALTFVTRWSFFGNVIGYILYKIDTILRKVLSKGPGGHLAIFEYRGNT